MKISINKNFRIYETFIWVTAFGISTLPPKKKAKAHRLFNALFLSLEVN